MANSVDPDQTAPIGAVCSGSTLFASVLGPRCLLLFWVHAVCFCSGSTLFASIFNLSVILGNYSQQMISADNIFRCFFFLGALRVSLILNCDSLICTVCTFRFHVLGQTEEFISI